MSFVIIPSLPAAGRRNKESLSLLRSKKGEFLFAPRNDVPNGVFNKPVGL
jgi:hypothetical protein